MRVPFICAALACLGACATSSPAPAPVPIPVPAAAPRLSPEEVRQTCLSRMYTARSRGAVHWQIYENCLKDHS